MSTPKTHQTTLPCGATLVRNYLGASPDELGTVAQWSQAADEMDQALGGGVFRGRVIRLWHMDRADTPLRDGDPNTPGYQVWHGCYLDPDGPGPQPGVLDIAVFPDGWRAEDPPQARPIPARAIAAALGVFGHEAGHLQGDRFGHLLSSPQVCAHLTALWRRHRSGAGHNEAEGFAEEVRALAGPLAVRGTFSDGKAYTQAQNPPLYTLIRCGPWLRTHVGHVDTDDYQAWDERLVWRRYDWVWDWARWTYVRTAGPFFSVTRDFRRWTWGRTGTGDGWIPA